MKDSPETWAEKKKEMEKGEASREEEKGKYTTDFIRKKMRARERARCYQNKKRNKKKLLILK